MHKITGAIAAALLALAVAAPAQADKALLSERDTTDRCPNLRGEQLRAEKLHTWRWKVKTAERGDCRRLWAGTLTHAG